LVRKRVSRIYYLKKFFSYPVTLSWDTIQKLGVIKIVRIFFSYLHSRLFPRREEKTLEDFFINRFGKNLYRTFFKDYTEKVWGIPCEKIPAEWGAQRIKELSVTKAIMHAFRSRLPFRKKNDLSQKGTETTLIQHFLYPKYGPGQLWEEVARIITNKGGVIHFNKDVKGIGIGNNKIESVKTTDTVSETGETFTGDYFFSTMPVKDLIAGIGGAAPREVATIAEGLQYRDFITIGMLVKKIKPANNQKSGTLISDNWIYIQEKDVKVGRLQIFNNWSPYMVKDPGTVWLGLEYFCNKEDSFWNRNDADLIEQAIDELVRIELIDRGDVLDHTVIRMEKTYPAYFGTYDRFDVVRDYVNQFNNLFLIGRNGMHKYNNADHSMLTAMQAVENIKNNISSKEDIWKVNTEEEYNG
jgi:protoporphyrinogen oxidase